MYVQGGSAGGAAFPHFLSRHPKKGSNDMKRKRRTLMDWEIEGPFVLGEDGDRPMRRKNDAVTL